MEFETRVLIDSTVGVSRGPDEEIVLDSVMFGDIDVLHQLDGTERQELINQARVHLENLEMIEADHRCEVALRERLQRCESLLRMLGQREECAA